MVKKQSLDEQKNVKDKRITVRIYSKDLVRLKEMALEEGLPYQTFITSILHKVAQQRLIDKKLISVD